MTELPPETGLVLGPVRRRATAPDGPSTPAIDTTVQLRPAGRPADGRGDDGRTVQLRAAGQAAAEQTVRLAVPSAEETVRLEAVAAEATAPIDPGRTQPLDVGATVRPAAVPSDGLRRFGPGVPPRAAAVWRGEDVPGTPERPKPGRRWDRWLLVPLVIMLVLLGYLLWDRHGRPVAVVGVTASSDPAGPGCDGTAVITGTLETDGGAGDLTYRWIRSDGTDSGPITQRVPSGQRRTEVALHWTFQGHGEVSATARLEVLKPGGGAHAETVFDYRCP
ncbi:hypothetical protein [Kitasatospora cheerisanensis]|uniref:Uncharacterized protein n=1 Tax=Kitasatospora cheerisanensis KCTC 2395 TaxID=1348663 RepID=A0A066ZCQ2_9ACTN|nr:hypothetical protein [Kitasatospora cheerisanensis]KDN87930.1 hypothetical protein KCH_03430 [Kitasatospora cheerisanensis KCTC 2395]